MPSTFCRPYAHGIRRHDRKRERGSSSSGCLSPVSDNPCFDLYFVLFLDFGSGFYIQFWGSSFECIVAHAHWIHVCDIPKQYTRPHAPNRVQWRNKRTKISRNYTELLVIILRAHKDKYLWYSKRYNAKKPFFIFYFKWNKNKTHEITNWTKKKT